jgi:type I restriction enzyme M protein
MRKDKGMNGDLDRLPQLTWIMFLKFLDDVETIRSTEAAVAGKKYIPLIDHPYSWKDWAEKPDGMTGNELIAFVNNDEAIRPDGKRGLGLIQYLRSLHGSSNGKGGRSVLANVFQGVNNRMTNGYLLRDVINKVNEINFTSSEQINILSHLYESILKELRDAAGDSGEFYTPRPVVKFMVKVINPHLGETLLDPAAGTGGFLVESYLHLKNQCKTAEDYADLQDTISGIEAKSLPYLLCQMNLLLHGMENPNIDPLNALRFPLNDIGDKERVDIVLTNPPFGGEEEKGILSNFPADKQTTETALLFLQLIMKKLRRCIPGAKGGRCGIVVPNGILFGDGVAARVKKDLIENFSLDTIVRLPEGVFSPYTPMHTNILFFNRNGPTKEIWYYQLLSPEGRTYTKTRPVQFAEFTDLMNWWNNRTEGKFSWKVPVEVIKSNGFNLDIKNPSEQSPFERLKPEILIDSILQKEQRIGILLQHIRQSLNDTNEQ